MYGGLPTFDQPVKFTKEIDTMITPWTYKTDLSVQKRIMVNNLEMGFSLNILNLFNFKSIEHVYAETGKTDDDHSLEDLQGHFNSYPSQYMESFFQLYQLINIGHRQHYRERQGGDLFGRPREIRFGIDFSF